METESVQAVTCNFCFEQFKTPLVLPCGHSICQSCVSVMLSHSSLIRPTSTGSSSILNKKKKVPSNTFIELKKEAKENVKTKNCSCPTCGSCFHVTDIKQLPINYTLKETLDAKKSKTKEDERICENECGKEAEVQCTQCRAFFCKTCFEESHKTLIMRKHQFQEVAQERRKKKKQIKRCYLHNKKLLVYCRNCRDAICYKCVVEETTHKGHEQVAIEKRVKELPLLLITQRHQMNQKYERLQQIQKDTEEDLLYIQQERDIAKQKVDQACDEQIEQINKHRIEMHNLIDQIHQTQDKRIRAKKEDLNNVQQTVSKNIENMNQINLNDEQEELINLEKQFGNTTKLMGGINATRLEHELLSVKVMSETEKEERRKEVKKIISVSEGKKEVKWRFVRAIGKEGSREEEFDTVWDAAIYKEEIYICDFGNNRIQILDTNGKFVRSFASSEPTAIAIDKLGILYVCEFDKGVVRYDNDGKVEKQITTSNFNTIICSYGIVVSKEGHVFVSDFSNHTVRMFNKEGTCIKQFGCKGSGVDQLMNPNKIALDEKGQLYVCDRKNNRIQVYDVQTGEHLFQIGKRGSSRGEFECPVSIRIDRFNRIVVGEFLSLNSRVQWIDEDKKWFGEILLGETDGGIGSITEDERGNLFLCQTEEHKILVYRRVD